MFISTLGTCRINSVFMKKGQKLRQAIEESPYTQAEFARLMDTDPQTIRNWIIRGIPARNAFKAGRLLGRDPEWLAFDDKDLSNNITQVAEKRTEYAASMFDLLTKEQVDLVTRLIREIARK